MPRSAEYSLSSQYHYQPDHISQCGGFVHTGLPLTGSAYHPSRRTPRQYLHQGSAVYQAGDVQRQGASPRCIQQCDCESQSVSVFACDANMTADGAYGSIYQGIRRPNDVQRYST